MEDCQGLSDETKKLTWENGETKMDIRARGGSERFHLAYSQQRFTSEQYEQIASVYCRVVQKKSLLRAWIATKKALEKTEERDQDGMCLGEFNVHVEAAAETGEKATRHFKLKVHDDWKKLDAEVLECNCRNDTKFSRRFISRPLPHKFFSL